jgi:hypothetical protein
MDISPPGFSDVGGALWQKDPYSKMIKKQFLTRSLPITVAGGVGGYMGAAKLRDLVREKFEKQD